MVLEILYPKPGAAQSDLIVDIVAVHGLNGDPTNTWKHPANNHFWLQDFLPLDVQGARVLNYGYNADVVFGNTTADVWDHAKSLLGSLIDERETNDESKRPIIFIAHSLGGIIVKQALAWAHREPRYQSIREHTIGIVFFGTPHRGSDKAKYGKILANVATGVMHKPKSKLISALRSNSETLMRLTSEFKFEAPNMEIMTFYETKPISKFSRLIVEKHSALLELSHEDTQPVDANHRDMCKFDTRNHETYKKLVKRVNRILNKSDQPLPGTDCSIVKFRNKHFELPFDVSPYFTGGDDVRRELRDHCLPSEDSHLRNLQRRFVLYGLGGSGKTQMALKFANDHRERFWGVFFIDASSADMAEQGFLKMARICKVGEKMDDFKRYLTNSLEPWLLILDNADDPLLDISQFFPVGNRGTIIVTSRNPDCRCHATVGSKELREMESDEAINLLLRSGDLPSEDKQLRDLALPIVQTLGYLALAVNHAGASIRQRVCSLGNYLDHYAWHRKKLLRDRPVQASSDYKYTVYTTWDLSVDSIKESAKSAKSGTAVNALELLTLFGFCHFDDISENMFRSAWAFFAHTERYLWWQSNLVGIIKDQALSTWDSLVFNQAIQLLSSYSLIHVSGPNNRISLHPLVHSWIRDSLDEEGHLMWWNITISTLALASDNDSEHLQRQLKVHVFHCIGIRKINDFFQDDVPLDRVEISHWIILVFSRHPWKDALMLSERALEYSRRVLGDECYPTTGILYRLAFTFNSLFQYQKTVDLLQDQVDISIRVAGPADPLTLQIMGELSHAYRNLDRVQEALGLTEKSLAICEKSLDESDDPYLSILEELALTYNKVGRYEEAVGILKKVVAKRKEIFAEEDIDVLYSEHLLACAYADSGQHQTALDVSQTTMKKAIGILVEGDPFTLDIMASTAITFGEMGQSQNGIPLMTKALDVGSSIGLDVERLEKYKGYLEWLESLRSNTATTVSEGPLKPQEQPHSEGQEPSNRRKWWLWSRNSRRLGGPSS